MTVVLPIQITFHEWASQIRVSLPTLTFPLPSPVESWRDWACQVVRSNALDNVPLPTQLAYPQASDWSRWAAYFVNSVYT